MKMEKNLEKFLVKMEEMEKNLEILEKNIVTILMHEHTFIHAHAYAYKQIHEDTHLYRHMCLLCKYLHVFVSMHIMQCMCNFEN